MPVSHPELHGDKKEKPKNTKPHTVIKDREKLEHT